MATIPANITLSTKFAFAQDGDFADDIEILDHALTLEYLESEFYRQGNAAGLLAGKEAMYLQQVGVDETRR